MSVSYKSKENIQGMTGGLLYFLDSYCDVLTESKAFKGVKKWEGEREGLEVLFICWLMFRMWVANKVAYAVQYSESVDLHEEIPDIDPVFIEPSELAADLRNLNYNIYTNGGQCWMDHEWHSAFKEIADRIKAISEKMPAGNLLRVV
ncbi:MAG: hypothetical protein V1874_17815 [Spirochaetota bacterium]